MAERPKGYKIGRRVAPGKFDYVCTIKPKEKGALVEDAANLSDAELGAILAVFSEPAEGEVPDYHGGRLATKRVVAQPGSEQHFHFAAYRLPKPFVIMGYV